MATAATVRPVATATGDDGGTRSAAATVHPAGRIRAAGPDPATGGALPAATAAGRPGAGARGRVGSAVSAVSAVTAVQATAGHAALAADARHHRRRVPDTDAVVRVRQLHRAVHERRRARRAGPARPGAVDGLELRRTRPTCLPRVHAARPLVPWRPSARADPPVSAEPLVHVRLAGLPPRLRPAGTGRGSGPALAVPGNVRRPARLRCCRRCHASPRRRAAPAVSCRHDAVAVAPRGSDAPEGVRFLSRSADAE